MPSKSTPPAKPKTYVAWLRAIGPISHRKMSMTALGEACRAAGFGAVRVWAQTGNVLLTSPDPAARVEQRIDAIVTGFDIGLNNRTIVRSLAGLKAVIGANPFPEAAAERPSRLLVCFMEDVAGAEATMMLEAHPGPERLRVIGREVFVDYAEGVGISKIGPGVIERRLRLVGTARNWNTIGKMVELARR
jgi:uncharacterized protein (DUF1697 family)